MIVDVHSHLYPPALQFDPALKRVHVDTMCFHPPAIRAAIDTFGVDHVLLGSDCPPVSIPWERTIGAVRALGLPAADEARIVGGNACRLFGLT